MKHIANRTNGNVKMVHALIVCLNAIKNLIVLIVLMNWNVILVVTDSDAIMARV